MKRLLGVFLFILTSLLVASPAVAATHLQNEDGESSEEEAPDNGPLPDAEDVKAGLDAFLDDPGGVVAEWVKTDGVLLLGKLALFLVLFLVAKIVAGVVAGMVRKAVSSSRMNVSDLLQDFAVNTSRKVIVFLGVLFALSAVGVPIGPFLAAFGVAGFVIGFALQDTMSNFASGVMILLYRPYDVGDAVTAGGETGKVRAMSLVSTTLITPDNQVKVVPNGSIWGGVITNVTANDTRRVDFKFGIGYEDDIPKAEKILMEIISGHKKTLDDPAPFVKLGELADSSVNFTVRVWAATSDYWTVYFDVTREVKLRFDAEGISIPFPQRDVHMHQVA